MAQTWLHDFCVKHELPSTIEHLLMELNLTDLSKLMVFSQTLLNFKDKLSYAIQSEANSYCYLSSQTDSQYSLPDQTYVYEENTSFYAPTPPSPMKPHNNSIDSFESEFPDISAMISSLIGDTGYAMASESPENIQDANDQLYWNSTTSCSAWSDGSLDELLEPISFEDFPDMMEKKSEPQLSLDHTYHTDATEQRREMNKFENRIKNIWNPEASIQELNRSFLLVVKDFRQKLPNRQIGCKLCPFTSNRADHVKIHLARHANLKLYPCELCGKRFMRMIKPDMRGDIVRTDKEIILPNEN